MLAKKKLVALSVVLVAVLVGVVTAAYLVDTYIYTVSINEPIETVEIWSIDGAVLYPGGDLSKGGWAQIGIINNGPPLTITVKFELLSGGAPVYLPDVFEWYGMVIHPAAVLTGETTLSFKGAFNPDIVHFRADATEGSNNVGTFTIGTKKYTATSAWDTTIGSDSNMAWVFIAGKLSEDAAPLGAVELKVYVFRG